MRIKFLSGSDAGYVLASYVLLIGGEKTRIKIVWPVREHKARLLELIQMVSGRS